MENLANNVLEGIKRGGVYMDSQLVWQDSFNIGVEAIDKEHQRLFKIINRLFEYGEEKSHHHHSTWLDPNCT